MTDLRTPPVNDGDLFSERARQYVQEKAADRIHVLEAGCGRGSGLDLGDGRHLVTGVDMEAPALRAHTSARRDLDTWYLGDLRTVPMPPRAYDVVHASYLIERIPHAELVLDRFVAALKPGGLLLVRLRDRNTAFGFLDRTLPRWPRELFWRRLGAASPARRPATRGTSATAATTTPGTSGTAGTSSSSGTPAPAAQPVPAAQSVQAAQAAATAPAVPAQAAPAALPAPAVTVEPRLPAAASPPPAVYEPVASRQGMQWYCVMRGLVISEEYTLRTTLDAAGAGSGLAAALCRLVSAFSRGGSPPGTAR
ncbi:class I SAM-dependent methyltransferase [Actinomadura yumaensis]|uniref:class I SAM-dependent methyltransferase n=1 Tax=Actinomadura yumaensis TaxID=111807 RepID=UPI00360F8B82